MLMTEQKAYNRSSNRCIAYKTGFGGEARGQKVTCQIEENEENNRNYSLGPLQGQKWLGHGVKSQNVQR